MPTTAPQPPTTATATATPSGTASPQAPVPYTGSITLDKVVKGTDALSAGVDKDLAALKDEKFPDRVAMLLAVGPIGIRVHQEFYSNFLAAQMGVDPEDLAAWSRAPERDADKSKLAPAFAKVDDTFARYKAFVEKREGALPAASRASCLDAKKRHLELATKLPAKNEKLTNENLGIVANAIVAGQALKRCKKAGHDCIAEAATAEAAAACK